MDADVSVIVSTRDRMSTLPRTLESVRASAAAAAGCRVQLVVVDNGSTDGTADYLRALAASASFDVTRVNEPVAGLSRARNAGVAAATGAILAFTDDDCVVSAGWIREIVAHFGADAGPVLRGGRVDLGDPTDWPVTIKTDGEPGWLSPGENPSGFVHGCNMALPRDLARRIGPFDERLGAGSLLKSGEDTDFVLRAVAAGAGVQYVPDMAVQHYHGRRSIDQVAALFRQYAYGNGALAAKFFRRWPTLAKWMWWNLKDAALETVGAIPKSNREYGLSRRQIAAANLRGFFSYLFRCGRG